MTARHRFGEVLVAVGLFAACTVWAQTDGNVEWNGEGASAFWTDAGNWVGGQYPNISTPGILTFATNGMGVTGIVEVDRQVGGIIFGGVRDDPTITHTIDMGGHTLTVAGDIVGTQWEN